MPGQSRYMPYRRKWSVENMSKAVKDVSMRKMSVREASRHYEVPKTTLQDRVKGRYSIETWSGAPPVFSKAEEDALVKWILEMAAIGYGVTREKLQVTVKTILDREGRKVNVFNENKPGKDWYYGFLRRHPQLSTRRPEALELSRAKMCSPENINEWFIGFENFLLQHNITDPAQIYNCDESGFPFQPKSGRIIVESSSRHAYKVASNSKQSITTLVCACADGTVLPPFHIYPGKVFSGEVMEGCVPNAYFGITKNGWIDIPQFYGWLANRFVRQIPPRRPVVLLLDGHPSHYDVDTSKFCKENQILLYCLPPHSSHLTQPLDVGFFKPMKDNYYKEVAKYNETHPGNVVTKRSFASIFHQAWIKTISVEMVTRSFAAAGIWPVNRAAIPDGKLQPSRVYSVQQPPQPATTASPPADQQITPPQPEKNQTTLLKYFSYKKSTQSIAGSAEPSKSNSDIPSISHPDIPSGSASNPDIPSSSCVPTAGQATVSSPAVSDVFREILVHPKVQQKTTRAQAAGHTIRHISSAEFIKIQQEKERKKHEEEELKKKRAEERQEKKKHRDAEKEERKRKFEERKRNAAAKREEKQKKRKEKEINQRKAKSKSDRCGKCGGRWVENDPLTWIQCDEAQGCTVWYHLNCTNLAGTDESAVNDLTWMCEMCSDS